MRGGEVWDRFGAGVLILLGGSGVWCGIESALGPKRTFAAHANLSYLTERTRVRAALTERRMVRRAPWWDWAISLTAFAAFFAWMGFGAAEMLRLVVVPNGTYTALWLVIAGASILRLILVRILG